MLFANIHSLLKRGITLNLILAAAGEDKIEVTVLPSSENASGMQLVAKTFVASPRELDEQFPGVMAGYASANLSLKDQLEALQKQAEEAAVTASEVAKAQAAKKSAPKAASTSTGKSSGAVKHSLMDVDGDEDGCTDLCGGDSGADSIDGFASVDAGQPQLISL